MRILVERKNHGFHFEATNETGNKVQMDANPDFGGKGQGARPMELLIMGLGGCSGIDIVNILNKQRQEITSMKMEIDADREEGKTPSLFERIKINFLLDGKIDPEKAKRAVELSMDKYCSVTKTLEKTAEITWDIILNGEKI